MVHWLGKYKFMHDRCWFIKPYSSHTVYLQLRAYIPFSLVCVCRMPTKSWRRSLTIGFRHLPYHPSAAPRHAANRSQCHATSAVGNAAPPPPSKPLRRHRHRCAVPPHTPPQTWLDRTQNQDLSKRLLFRCAYYTQHMALDWFEIHGLEYIPKLYLKWLYL